MKSLTIGLTGGIGSGKTFISSIFASMGVPIYDSDANAKRLMLENAEVMVDIKNLLGEKAYDSSGNLNRKFIAEIVFKEQKKLTKLNEIVHPAVRKDFLRYTQENQNKPIIINEAALFVENGSYRDFDYLISVVAPKRLRLQRVIKRDSSNINAVKSRIKAQSTDEEKIAVSHYVIYNDASDNLFRQISGIYAELLTFVKKEKQ